MKKWPDPRKVNPHHVQGISGNNAELLCDAKDRARPLGLSLSSCVTQLNREELARGAPFLITPASTKKPSSTRIKAKPPRLPKIKSGTNFE